MAFLIKCEVEVELMQDLTSSRELLAEALDGSQVPLRFPNRRAGANVADFQGLPGGIRLPDIFSVPGGGCGSGSGGFREIRLKS